MRAAVPFTAPGVPPEIVPAGAEARELTPTSTEVSVQINPEGAATAYRIEYGTSAEYGHTLPAPPLPEASIGEREVPVSASQVIVGVEPNVTYHWRVRATNSAGSATGADHTFLNDTAGETPPAGRAWEMVTPAQKNTAAFGRLRASTQIAIAADGSRLIAGTLQCFADSESCTGSGNDGFGEPFEFTRSPGGWNASALAPPTSQFPANSQLMVSPETGEALFEVPTPEGATSSLYVRRAGGAMQEIGPIYDAAAAPVRFARTIRAPEAEATQDFGHVVFDAEQEPFPTLTPAFTRKTPLEYSGTGNALPRLVAVTGGAGSTSLIGACTTRLGTDAAREPGILSASGETVFFTVEECAEGTGENAGPGHAVPVNEVFARLGAARTVPISEPSAFSPAAPYPGCRAEPCIADVNEQANWRAASFQAASADGSRALFESEQRLLDDAEEGANNLYEYDLADPAAPLTDISAGEEPGHGGHVEGLLAASADGSHVYFVSSAVLDSRPNASEEAAQEGANNLYVYDHGAARAIFIARLPESDSRLWGGEGPQDALANVTPDGRVLVFESHAALTPDTAPTGERQAFRYDAATAQLARVSVGQRGFQDDGNAGTGDATIVPSIEPGYFPMAGAHRGDPTMSDDGTRVFFQSPKGLTPGALNDVPIGPAGAPEAIYAQNVYEWHDGEVHLISDGRDTTLSVRASDVELLGSDTSAANVFFTTADPLVGEDTDTQVDIYDARTCTSASPCITGPPPPSASCTGEDCRSNPSAPPPTLTIASEQLTGAANVKPGGAPPAAHIHQSRLAAALAACRRAHRHSRRRRARCEALARRRHAHTSLRHRAQAPARSSR